MSDFFPILKEFRAVLVGEYLMENEVDSPFRYIRVEEFYCEESFMMVNVKQIKAGSDVFVKFFDYELVRTMN